MPNQPVLVVDICLLFERGGFFLFIFSSSTRHDTLDEGRIKGGLCLVSGKKKDQEIRKKRKSRSVVHRYLVSAKAQNHSHGN